MKTKPINAETTNTKLRTSSTRQDSYNLVEIGWTYFEFDLVPRSRKICATLPKDRHGEWFKKCTGGSKQVDLLTLSRQLAKDNFLAKTAESAKPKN